MEDDFKYEQGYGIVSNSLLQNLPILFDMLNEEDKVDSVDKELGKVLGNFDNLKQMAIYYFDKMEDSDNANLSWEVSQIMREYGDLVKDIFTLLSKLEGGEEEDDT